MSLSWFSKFLCDVFNHLGHPTILAWWKRYQLSLRCIPRGHFIRFPMMPVTSHPPNLSAGRLTVLLYKSQTSPMGSKNVSLIKTPGFCANCCLSLVNFYCTKSIIIFCLLIIFPQHSHCGLSLGAKYTSTRPCTYLRINVQKDIKNAVNLREPSCILSVVFHCNWKTCGLLLAVMQINHLSYLVNFCIEQYKTTVEASTE